MRDANRWLIAAAILAFALRFGYAAATGALRHPQTWEQEQMATNLVEGRGFLFVAPGLTYRSYAEPLYPYLAAAVYLLTGHSQTVVVMLQLIVASLTVWLGGRAAMLASGSGEVGVVAAFLLTLHPGWLRYSSVLHPTVLDVFFFTAAGLALVRYQQRPTLGRGCAAAALIGLGALSRPTILVFLLAAWWIARRLRPIAIITATALAIVAPWTIRNAFVHHEFMLTRSGSGYVFWLGNNPMASGSAVDAAGRPIEQHAPAELQRRLAAADETTRDRIFLDDARQYIRAHPAAAVIGVAERVYYFWWFSPQWGAAFAPRAKLVYRIWWGAILLLIVLGLIASMRAAPARRRDLLLLASLAVLVSALQSLYYVEGRHRLAVEPLVMPLAAVGVMVIATSGDTRPSSPFRPDPVSDLRRSPTTAQRTLSDSPRSIL